LLDRLAPWRHDRFCLLLRIAPDHPYMAHVGAGWALARLGLARFGSTRRRAFERMDRVLRWLAIDGYGFHEGYFRPRRAVVEQWRVSVNMAPPMAPRSHRVSRSPPKRDSARAISSSTRAVPAGSSAAPTPTMRRRSPIAASSVSRTPRAFPPSSSGAGALLRTS